MDIFSKAKRRQVMQSIKQSGSNIETTLAKVLWARGHRYRKNCKSIIGKPDIVMRKYKIAIFCDSEFWHGKNWKIQKNDFHKNKKFWHTKIERNIRRDKFVNKQLRKDGWVVLRFWGKDITRKTKSCIDIIEKHIGV
jgi:DNA mismatch endonuclease Vsr